MIFLFLCLTSLIMTFSRLIHVAANGIVSFFLMAEWYSIVYIHHLFFIHPSIDGHLGGFYVLAIVNNATMNTGVHVPFWIMLYPAICLGVSSSIFSFLRKLHTPKWLYQFTFPPPVQEDSLLSTPSSAFVVCGFFVDGHSDWCQVTSHRSFDLYFLNN